MLDEGFSAVKSAGADAQGSASGSERQWQPWKREKTPEIWPVVNVLVETFNSKNWIPRMTKMPG